jgi:hypothetical protein
MTKTLTLTASVMILLAISGHASRAQYLPVATGRSDQQHAIRAFNAFHQASTRTVERIAHRYHGGPKSND